MKAWWRRVRSKIAAGPIYGIASLLLGTVRLEVEGFEEYRSHPGVIFVGWHGRSMLPAKAMRGLGYWALISLSNDGNIQDGIFRKFGFRTIRGSTGRGGARALAESIRVLREGGQMAFTPDGPRGPRHEVQPGVILMAQKSGALIVPVASSARRRWLLGTWDRYLLPKPFTRAVMLCGEGIVVPRAATEEEIEAIRIRVGEAISALEREAESRMGHAQASSGV